ncbi:putative HD superfamily hydrolase of NAD metabolism [Butyrivibrio sp. ob235]|uniref:bis(5'-nucleosyl)-tetraphosphatase (symmetrical) YqeK n=2 Tax=Butyrivibrio TaxID=830 RepID=UPI0003B6DE7B|nr:MULTISPECIES: bis(5'-nucleosyl)-tetraphosphatase (symmetrical) YqeK [unclassified Butyrivibrio]SEK34041.1 putative HD superfamily hydrolase of NAD metabolism [Butyrivibrio sp. ob235]
MKIIDISHKFRKEMKLVLNADRFDHTLGVAYTAANMAAVHDVSIEKALIAGYLHDCAKNLDHEEQIKICKKYEVDISEVERRNPSLIHAKAGMCLAEHRYGIDDKEILSAIRWHTTGHPGMTDLEKIVFIADFIEPNRKPLEHMSEIRKEAYKNLDKCMLYILRDTLNYLKNIDKECDPMTQDTYDYYLKKGRMNNE